jgi:amidohydrolase
MKNPCSLAGAALLALPLLCASASAAAPRPAPVPVEDAVRAVSPAVIELRHRIHQNPELSNREFETAALVAGHLKALGLEVRTGIAHTGVVGWLKGGLPGPLVAVRADMDALPVTEDTPFPFKSTVRTTFNGQEVGVAHACGHDIHTAVLLGVASILAPRRDQLRGTVMFIFQPAEEGPPEGEKGGAKLMLEEGLFDKARPDAVFGLHAAAALPVGQLAYSPGPTTASSDSFEITLLGTSSHAAWPHLGVDPILMAAQAVLGLQTIRSRNLPPHEPSVLTVAQIHGGVRDNIIPAEVKLRGTVRLFDPKVQDEVERRMREILEGVAKGAGGSFRLEYTRKVPVLVSDPALVSRMLPTLERAVGAENVIKFPPSLAYDDFAYFAQQTPAFFFHLGTLRPGTTSGGHHTPTFQADDSSIPVGLRVLTGVLLDYLEGSGGGRPR